MLFPSVKSEERPKITQYRSGTHLFTNYSQCPCGRWGGGGMGNSGEIFSSEAAHTMRWAIGVSSNYISLSFFLKDGL